MRRNTKRGYMAVEAAIFLPIFIVSIITIGYLIKFSFIEENVCAVSLDEGHNLMKNAYMLPIAPMFTSKLETRLSDNIKEISNLKVCHFRYRYTKNSVQDLISYSVDYNINLNLPIPVIKNAEVRQTFMFRAFTGVDNSEQTSFDKLSQEKASETVYVFPRAGEKFHKENCTYIKSYPRQVILNKAIKRSYSPCRLCGAKKTSIGNIVYCFKYGKVYHRAKCKKVVKYIIAMERSEAEEKGYSACQKCYI